MNLSYLFQLFLSQFSPIAAFLAIASFLYVALGKSGMFHFHPIPRLILSTILGLYAANSFAFDFARIISVAGTVVTIGLIGILVWHVALQRGKTLQQSFGVIGTAASMVSKYQEDLLRKALELVLGK
jgi:hypothetical protein